MEITMDEALQEEGRERGLKIVKDEEREKVREKASKYA